MQRQYMLLCNSPSSYKLRKQTCLATFTIDTCHPAYSRNSSEIQIFTTLSFVSRKHSVVLAYLHFHSIWILSYAGSYIIWAMCAKWLELFEAFFSPCTRDSSAWKVQPHISQKSPQVSFLPIKVGRRREWRHCSRNWDKLSLFKNLCQIFSLLWCFLKIWYKTFFLLFDNFQCTIGKGIGKLWQLN